MPRYEYSCKRCKIIEVEQRITDEPLTRCPKCNCPCLKRLISSTTFKLNGSGWAKDLYSKSKKQ